MRWLRAIPTGWLGACFDILTVLCAHPLSEPFLARVDEMDEPEYKAAVPRPMDLGVVRKRLYSGAHAHHGDFARDVRLVWANARAYNTRRGSAVRQAANVLGALFEVMRASVAMVRGPGQSV